MSRFLCSLLLYSFFDKYWVFVTKCYFLTTPTVGCVVCSDANCDDGIIYNSTCYKIHKERVDWFTAINRCLSKKGKLAVFDDDIKLYFPSSLLTELAERIWIGLIKTWWTWPDAGLVYLSLRRNNAVNGNNSVVVVVVVTINKSTTVLTRKKQHSHSANLGFYLIQIKIDWLKFATGRHLELFLYCDRNAQQLQTD